jgi:hypothetical protein
METGLDALSLTQKLLSFDTIFEISKNWCGLSQQSRASKGDNT